MRDALLILLVCTLFCFIYINQTPICSADTITVGIGEGYDYNKIQSAIDNSSQGDILNIDSGTYDDENIVIDKSITLNGINGRSSTFVDGKSSSARTIEINADDVTIHGLTIENNPGKSGGFTAVKVNYVLNFTIYDCTIKNAGDALYFLGSDNAEIYDNNINNNQRDGINLHSSDNCNIHDNTISDNSGNGIRLQFTSSQNTINQNTISGNDYYGINIVNSNNNKIHHNTISDNLLGNAYENGGSNTWYDTSTNEGNTWDDYQELDENEDGIGETPYAIPETDNQDIYPLGVFLEPNQPPEVQISISPNPAQQGQTVYFNANVIDDGTIITREWRINGAVVSNNEDFTTSSLAVGTHTVTFKVKDDNEQWSNTATTQITITSTVNQQPTVTQMAILPTDITYGDTVYFEGDGADPDTGDNVVGYWWSSDIDGFLYSGKQFTRTDLSVGTHTISFKVRDTHNYWSEINTMTVNVRVNPSIENTNPVARTGGPYNGETNETINLDGSESYDPDVDDAITQYKWDFGDDTVGEGMNVQHTYSKPGTYTVKLTVKDTQGGSAQNTTIVIISETQDQQNNNENEEENDKIMIPGFEIILLLVSMIILVIIKKRK